MSDLDTLLSGTPTQDTPPPAQPEPMVPRRDYEPERQPPERVDPEPGESEQPPAPPAEEQEPSSVPISAVKDERRRRQEAERIAAEYQRKVEQYEAQMRQVQQPPQERPDLFQNPDGALDFVEQRLQKAFETRLLNMSVAAAKRTYPDYAEAEQAFIAAVQHNPTLYDAMMADPDPAGYAYRVGQQVQVLREVGSDPAAYRERVRQEEREAARREWEAQQAEAAPQQVRPDPSPRRSLPPSLANARDTNGRFQPAWGGPPALKDILAPRR